MQLNLPPKVRYGIYIFVSVGGIVVTYLSSVGVVGQPELTAWSAFSVFVGGLAAVNTDTDKL